MKRHYLHLSAYFCDKCGGPVIAGATAVRENEISRETDVQQVGAICLSCGHRQNQATKPGFTRHFPPTQWDANKAIDASPFVVR
jgi:RNase P subunit RPR2